MNKIELKTLSTIVNYEKIITNKHGKFICNETYTDNILTKQSFKRTGEAFHNVSDPEKMHFKYYGDINFEMTFLNYARGNYKELPEQVLIHNLESFKEFDKLYCLWMSMDHNIYSILKKDPVPGMIMHLELWGIDHDLNAAKKFLENDADAIDIKIVANCYENYTISGKHTLKFKYRLNKKLMKKVANFDYFPREIFLKKYIGLEKFKLPDALDRFDEEFSDED